MMNRSTERILTTHVGSLPRSPDLLSLVRDRNDGKDVDSEQFEPLLKQGVNEAVKHQVDTGLSVVNDGELSRITFANQLGSRLNGFEVDKDVVNRGPSHPAEAAEFPEFYERPSASGFSELRWWRCVSEISWKGFSEVERDIKNLKDAVKGLDVAEVFMTSPAPTLASSRQPNGGYYESEEEFVHAMADTLKREYRAIVDAGFVLQVDMPFTASRRLSGAYAELIPELRKDLAYRIEVLNYALADIPAEKARFHVCYGADESPHNRDPELADFIDILLTAKPAGLTVVSASPRHQFEAGVFEDVKLPEGKILLCGVIDHSTNIVEHPRTVAERIVRFAKAVGRENIIAGADCGFSPTAGMNRERVDPRVMWAKFGSLVQGAALASEELWS
jgi:5-methyltetrahydropteroyltriglutamate--homocysteine methyltransferase